MPRPWNIEKIRELLLSKAEGCRLMDDNVEAMKAEETARKLQDIIVTGPESIRNHVRELFDSRPDFLPAGIALQVIELAVLTDVDPLIHDMVDDIVREFHPESKAEDEQKARFAIHEALAQGKKIQA